jgi:hypothetical protein
MGAAAVLSTEYCYDYPSPCVTRLSPRAVESADVRSPSRDKSAAPYQRQGFVEGVPFMWLLLHDATCLHDEDICFYGGCVGRH